MSGGSDIISNSWRVIIFQRLGTWSVQSFYHRAVAVFTSFTLVLIQRWSFKTPIVLNLSFYTRTAFIALKDPKSFTKSVVGINDFYIGKTKRRLHDLRNILKIICFTSWPKSTVFDSWNNPREAERQLEKLLRRLIVRIGSYYSLPKIVRSIRWARSIWPRIGVICFWVSSCEF